MRNATLLMLTALVPIIVFAQPADRAMLWDFEDGIEGWSSNPWSGGKGWCEPAEGKFGKGIQGFWEDVPGSGTLISPYVNEDAEWRAERWAFISFWLKGDGSQKKAKITIETEGPKDEPIGYSRPVAIDSTQWRRFVLDTRNFWNREKVSFDSTKIRRIYFTSTGTRQISIDHIALEREQRPAPMAVKERSGETHVDADLVALDDTWRLRFDPSGLPSGTRASAEVLWPSAANTRAQADLPDPPTDDVLLRLPPPDRQPGEARLTLVLSKGGDELGKTVYEFPATYSLPPLRPQLGILPTPKRLEVLDAPPFALPATLTIRGAGEREIVEPVLDYIAGELRSRWQVNVELAGELKASAQPTITISGGPPPTPAKAGPEVGEKGAEAYHLQVDSSGATIIASDRPGLRYGAITVLHLIGDAVCAAPREVPSVRITDWPSLPIRGITIPLPTGRWGYPNDAPVDAAFFRKYLLRTCLQQKLNTVVLLVHQGMEYHRNPEVTGPAAWSQDTLRELVATLKAHDINPVPCLNSLGHANWLVIPIAKLREDGDTNTLCTRHPDSKRILLDCYQEVIDVFEPTHFHMGLDEIRWKTFSKPEEERCKLCAGIDKREIFLEHVRMLRDFLTGQGITPIMWSDMVLRKHGGGPPFNLDDTLEDLPRDIMIANWSFTLDSLANRNFDRLGFRVIQANSRGVTTAQGPYVAGNFFGVWLKLSWLTETASGATRHLGYSYLSILTAAEYSWNLYPDAMARGVGLREEFFEAREQALTRLALDRPIGRLEPVAPAGDAEGLAACVAGRVEFALWREPEVPDAEASVSVNAKASALYFLLAAAVPEDERTEFYKEFRKKVNWPGVPIGDIIIRYEDGAEVTRPILYGYEVRDAVDARLPYAYGAVGYWTDPEGRTWYAVPWVNPTPEKVIAEVSFRRGATAAQPMVRAVAKGVDG